MNSDYFCLECGADTSNPCGCLDSEREDLIPRKFTGGLVNTSQVIPSGQSFHYTVKKMIGVLRAQGQIEPLQVAEYVTNSDGIVTYITHYNDPHGADIVEAAKKLNWPTLLVVINKRYVP